VEEDPAPARREHHRLRPGGRRDRAERRHGLPRRLAADLLGREVLEEAEIDPAAAAVEAGAPLAVLAEGDALDGEPAEILAILCEVSERIGDQDLAGLIGVAPVTCLMRLSKARAAASACWSRSILRLTSTVASGVRTW